MRKGTKRPQVLHSCTACGAAFWRPPGGKHRCRDCICTGRTSGGYVASRTGGTFALVTVRRAVVDGRLPSARTLRCADCGDSATEYDHRDYNRPLAIDAVCRGCNARRGPAIPLRGSIERLLEREIPPYTLRPSAAKLCRAMGRPDLADGLPKTLTVEHWRLLWPQLTGAPAVPEKAEAA